ncbi:MAG TPA: 4-(cytidine 5'-diphospho)-2-C-methyl-D-erythritol kinase [Dehalococcoidia bacterium]|nr:4-(cytidine 5'-diphospho)-2-C-methyl-D-erythritol kinase [Dehalococcoidia bacterium]
MRTVRALAPAKINWTLEVLGKRDDGYHELRSVLQTVSLCDRVSVSEADETRLTVSGRVSGLHGLPVEDNLAFRAYEMLAGELGRDDPVAISIDKQVPVAAGLGGGSSDAAAVMRALLALWDEELPPRRMREIAARIGSDVPFFVECGSVMVAGRGEQLTVLSEAPRKEIVLIARGNGAADKTGSMFEALEADDYLDGARSIALASLFNHRLNYGDQQLVNSFDQVARGKFAEVGADLGALEEATGRKGHVAGSGPSVYAALDDGDRARWAAKRLSAEGRPALYCRTLASVEALRLEVSSD